MSESDSIDAKLKTLTDLAAVGLAPSARATPDAERAAIQAIARSLRRLGARVLLRTEPDYPAGLNDLPDPPAAVFVRGALPADARAVAVVGSRAASPYGVDRARSLASDLSGLGFTVVSGLARGIDAAAHRGALEAGGPTVALLPGGLDAVTPRHHLPLAEQVASCGGLLTEIATGEPRWRGMFLRRNRLIAAVAAAVVVVEASRRSGSLSTAAIARRLGRPVLAVPGDVDRETSRGCHALIRGGAGLCETAGDVLGAIESSGAASAAAGTPESRILAALDDVPLHIEIVAGAAGLALEDALAGLFRLELIGVASSLPGQRWARSGVTKPGADHPRRRSRA